MSQNPQNPRPNKNPPLTSAQQKRQNVVQMRQERQERQQSAQQQGRWLIISAIAVIVVIAVGVIIYAVINGQNKNTNSSHDASSGTTPLLAVQPTLAATVANTVAASSKGGVPPVNGNEVTTPSGLRYIDTQVGTGATPTKGQTIVANYTGYLENGTVFDSSIGKKPFETPIGVGRVIKGWDEGFLTMKVGGKRRLIISPDLGYGAQGAGGVIPGNATLIFDVELLGIK